MLHNIENESSEVNHKKYVGKASKKMENSMIYPPPPLGYGIFHIFFKPFVRGATKL